jgi:hypothetical protein
MGSRSRRWCRCSGRGGTNWEVLEEWKKELGFDRLVTYIAPDFDDPLPADFLITPGPC